MCNTQDFFAYRRRGEPAITEFCTVCTTDVSVKHAELISVEQQVFWMQDFLRIFVESAQHFHWVSSVDLMTTLYTSEQSVRRFHVISEYFGLPEVHRKTFVEKTTLHGNNGVAVFETEHTNRFLLLGRHFGIFRDMTIK